MAFSFPSLSSLRQPRRSLVGVDIDPAALRVVQLARHHSGLTVERLACAPLPQAAVSARHIEQPGQVAQALRQLWQVAGLASTQVAIALPSSAIITHRFTLPAGLAEDHLEMQVHNMARRFLPFALEDVCLDFEELGPSSSAPDMVDIQLAAARRADVEQRTAVVALAGLQAVVVDGDRYAACNALARQRLPAQPIALLQTGPQHSQLSVLQGWRLLHERELPGSGVALLPGAPGEEDADDQLVRATAQALRTLPAGKDGAPTTPQRLLVSGAATRLPHLCSALAHATGLSASSVDAFAGMRLSSHAQATIDAGAGAGAGAGAADADAGASAAWLVACGLALRNAGSEADDAASERGQS